MPQVIIGHTTSDSVRVWIRGDSSSTVCELTLRSPGDLTFSQTIQLLADRDFTATVEFARLDPEVAYAVHARFAPSDVLVRGRARTLAEGAGRVRSFSFVLSSCNLSIVSVNDFLALLSATAGTALAMSSLDLPPHRWNRRLRWLRGLIRPLARKALRLTAGTIQASTGLKQSGSRYIRSPFLKISAVFESCVLDIPLLPRTETEETTDMAFKKRLFLAVGDRVESSWGASGVVASMADVTSQGVRRVVVTLIDGRFEKDAVLFRRVDDDKEQPLRRLGPILDARTGRPWYQPAPSFFIHAGDQIYYDFPAPQREPRVDDYRLAYREAWFEDEALRHVLAYWPHCMTLDDHEIADQFALDFEPPDRKSMPKQYLDQAITAYREYAHALNPPNDGRPWFTFAHGRTQFFVMDTRTQRHNARGVVIDSTQLSALLDWMSAHRDDLKFVVTSVPFVAEIDESVSEDKDDWFKGHASPAQAERHSKRDQQLQPNAGPDEQPGRNPEHDKWTARRFLAQRHAIMEYIAAHRIERLVFLTGDMHCCYHATMSLGLGNTKYESVVVHELAGGPVNQLQLTDVNQFVWRRTSRTAGPRPVDYDVSLERFHGDVSAVMHIAVHHVECDQITATASLREKVPEVEWNVIRTLTDPGPDGWLDPDTSKPADSSGLPVRKSPEPVMGGRISFAPRRQPEELRRW